MEAENLQNGTLTATIVRNSSAEDQNPARNIRTLADLLNTFQRDPPSNIAMLRTTSAHLAKFIGKQLDEILLDSILDVKDRFRRYLESSPYKEASIRSYVNYARILIKQAQARGWRPGDGLSEQWLSIVETAKKKRCGVLARSMAKLGKAPGEITAADVERWIADRVQQGCSFKYEKAKKRLFWRLLRDGAYHPEGTSFPLQAPRYGIPLDRLPRTLRNEISEILRWKTAEFSIDRPKNGQHRTVTSKNLRRVFTAVSGYAINILGQKDISSIRQLITKPIFGSYIEWSINERHVKGRSLQGHLGMLLTAVGQHPAYRELIDLRWGRPMIDSIRLEPEQEIKIRKAAKYLDYSILERIPAQLRDSKPAEQKKGARRVARLVMDELLIRLLLTLAWRQNNIRHCRIAGPKPNLFKAPIDQFSLVDKPQWVLEEEKRSPMADFWQFKFCPAETKTGVAVHAVLPRPLVALLEEYLRDFRPALLGPVDPLTLFVNCGGRAISQNEITDEISELTLRYGGRVVTPHLFRDVVAYAWLKAHSADYLTLSKLLWHRDVKTTIHYYGGRFNESSGVCAMESWLEERAKGSK